MSGISDNSGVCPADPLTEAARRLFGLPWLFPYQRLVSANLLQAAQAAGIVVRWPGHGSAPAAGLVIDGDCPENPCQSAEGPGRQIVILPTGAGKSLCFQLPAMLMEGVTLVIYPILSLMADQQRRLEERGFAPVLIRGGQSTEEREQIRQKLRSGKSKFIIANPEVLLTPGVQKLLEEFSIVHTVIDEAHCVSEWGESFRPAYLEIHAILDRIKSPLVTAFTATASAPVLEKIEKYIFGEGGAHKIIGNPDRPNIEYRAQGCILRNLAVRDMLLANKRPAIVFCSSRPGTEKLARYLRNGLAGETWGNEIRFYHAGLLREEKKQTEAWFLRNTEAVLVSTCAFGLGVDKTDIRTVIHRDCPPSVEAYLQESGRAGRDGGQSRAVLLWGPDDEKRLKPVRSPQDRERLIRLFAYARNHRNCRREALLRMLHYEGEWDKPQERCCDVCSGESSSFLREEKSLWDFFYRNRRSYALGEAAAVLAGAEKVNWSEDEAEEAVKALIGRGVLRETRFPFWKNKITINSRNS